MNEPLDVLPSLVIAPSLRQTIAALYREYAMGAADLGMDRLAATCEEKAAALEYGGVLDLEPAT